jgi:transposase
MPYTVEQTDQMESALRALPPMDSSKRRLTKQAVVKRLAREIAALQGRGYSMEQVSESLRGVGLEITTPTLKSYLQRVKKRTGKAAPKRQGRSAPSATTAAREQQTPPAAAEPKADATAKRGGKDAFLVKDKDSY